VYAEALSRVALFDGLDPGALDRLARSCRPLNVPAAAFVYRHGDDGNAFFVVVAGRLAAYRDAVGKPAQLVAHFLPGDFFGEMCLYDEAQRQTSVRADEASRLLRVTKEDLQLVLSAQPRLALRLHVAAAKRRSLEAKAALELGRRAELRIRLGMPVRLELAGGAAEPVLENLSVGGMCLGGAPPEWQPDTLLRGALVVGRVRLPVTLRVAWRRGAAVGVAFETRAADHERTVYRILRELAGVDDAAS
jgi:CRP-like cAMP-binding protein